MQLGRCDTNMSEKLKMHECSFCGRAYGLKSSLQIHQIEHKAKNILIVKKFDSDIIEVPAIEKEESNDCDYANTVSIQTSNYNEAKSLTSPVCEKQCNGETSLKVHMLSHSFKIPECDFRDHTKKALKKTYRCGSCGQTYPSLTSLKNHEVSHANAFECHKCHEIFLTKRDFGEDFSSACKHSQVLEKVFLSNKQKIHKEKSKKDKHRCCVCKVEFPTPDLLNQHMSEGLHECSLCLNTFKNCNDVQIHLKNHKLDCEVCGKKLHYRQSLKSHMKFHKGLQVKHSCSECEMQFTTKYKLQHHVKRAHLGIKDMQCEICGKLFYGRHYKIHMLTHTGERPHKCSQCGARFVQRPHLLTHMKIHTGERNHICDKCGKAFTTRGNLVEHYNCHLEGKPFICSICLRGFTYLSSLRVHKRKHYPNPSVVCAICRQQFIKKEKLLAHYEDHSTEELQKLDSKLFSFDLKDKCYTCELCDVSHKSKFFLWIHYQDHSQDELQKVSPNILKFIKNAESTLILRKKEFCCTVCNRMFDKKQDLGIHMRSHTGEKPYECNVCDKAFYAVTSLKLHQRIHTGERTHKCSMCNKSFVQRIHLKVHMNTHTGEKPFACTICGKTFALNGNRKMHERIHAKDVSFTSLTTQCHGCLKDFTNQREYDIHLKVCSKLDYSEVKDYSSVSNTSQRYVKEERNADLKSYIQIVDSFVDELISTNPCDILKSQDDAKESSVIISLHEDENDENTIVITEVENCLTLIQSE